MLNTAIQLNIISNEYAPFSEYPKNTVLLLIRKQLNKESQSLTFLVTNEKVINHNTPNKSTQKTNKNNTKQTFRPRTN